MFNAFQWNCFNLVYTCNIALILFLKRDITKFRIPPPLSHNVTLRRPPPPLTCDVIYEWPLRGKESRGNDSTKIHLNIYVFIIATYTNSFFSFSWRYKFLLKLWTTQWNIYKEIASNFVVLWIEVKLLERQTNHKIF